MKRMSVKMKITLWYALCVAAIIVFSLGVVTILSENLLRVSAEGELREQVEEFVREEDFTDDEEEEGEYYEDGVYYSLYDTGGRLCAGSVPADFPVATTLKNMKMQRIVQDGHSWMTYDMAMTRGEQVLYWIRGVTSMGTLNQVNTALLRSLFVICPLLALLAIVSGYFVTGKALRPVEEALENEKRFTADASHELRTPAAVIMAQCEYALLEDTDREEMRECVQVIFDQSRKMTALITQLLMLARQDAGKEKLQLETVNLSLLAETVAEELQQLAGEREITIKTDIQQELLVRGDQSLLMRLLVNLTENGIQYGKKGGTVWITLQKKGHQVEGSVRDNGIGIAREHLEDIWKRFYREDRVRKGTKESHSGLGLSMVRWIVSAHHGTIAVKSEEGEGTIFTFLLPRISAEP